MLDPIIDWFRQAVTGLWHAFYGLVKWLLAPFTGFYRFFMNAGAILKIVLGVLLVPFFFFYGWFVWDAAFIRNYDTDWPSKFSFENRTSSAGEQVAVEGGTQDTRTCGRSGIVEAVNHLVAFNVNDNAWISSHPLYKAGFFGIEWDATPFMDNKANFQRGVHQASTRIGVELADQLGRVRGTSEIDRDLQAARGAMQFDNYTWFFNPFSNQPFGPTTRSQTYYRDAMRSFARYNDRLERCQATFDARADNLMAVLDRIAKDIGSTSASIKDRAESNNSGWFDTRADNQFYFAKGQLYAQYGILRAARADFQDVIELRQIGDLWTNMESQMRSAIELDPFIVSNGREDGWIMPSHLTTIGFYILRVRANLVEVRSVLDR
ncbi:MAG: DUF2333 family protein [Pseudomonadota bacterium]